MVRRNEKISCGCWELTPTKRTAALWRRSPSTLAQSREDAFGATGSGPHYPVNVGTGYTYKLHVNDRGPMRLDEPDEVFR